MCFKCTTRMVAGNQQAVSGLVMLLAHISDMILLPRFVHSIILLANSVESTAEKPCGKSRCCQADHVTEFQIHGLHGFVVVCSA